MAPAPAELDLDTRRVAALLEEVGREELLPRHRTLHAEQVREKSPGEWVTDADTACEARLERALRALLPGSMVIGEEAAHAQPQLLDAVREAPLAWVVDPLDGTRHFAAGDDSFGIMVALLIHGRTHAGFIHLPAHRVSAWGTRTAGVVLDGQPCRLSAAPPLTHARGGLLTGFLPAALKHDADAAPELRRTDAEHHCAALRYIDILRGREHFALYYRTLPWDHAAGCLLIEMAGGVARRFDGRPYRPDDDSPGLLVGSDEALWRALRQRVLPSLCG